MSNPAPLRAAVVGLGMMGRHHARILQSDPTFEFVGAVDPVGDTHSVLRDPTLLHSSVTELLAATANAAPQIAVVAVPTAAHAAATRQLTAAGVGVLIEKPLAATGTEAEALIETIEADGVPAAVGHVERYNAALIELRRRVNDGQLGDVFLVATERRSPFPERIRDVGVVKDLATHDLDLISWLGGADATRVSAETQHRMGRNQEDMLLAHGRLENGRAFQCSVDWLTPAKVRRTRVLGERGMLVADTVHADLTFYENADVPTTRGWEAIQTLRGVAEGDMTRYAITRREPLAVELETFAAYMHGDTAAPIVSLREGLKTLRLAEACLQSADQGQTISLAQAV